MVWYVVMIHLYHVSVFIELMVMICMDEDDSGFGSNLSWSNGLSLNIAGMCQLFD